MSSSVFRVQIGPIHIIHSVGIGALHGEGDGVGSVFGRSVVLVNAFYDARIVKGDVLDSR